MPPVAWALVFPFRESSFVNTSHTKVSASEAGQVCCSATIDTWPVESSTDPALWMLENVKKMLKTFENVRKCLKIVHSYKMLDSAM